MEGIIFDRGYQAGFMTYPMESIQAVTIDNAVIFEKIFKEYFKGLHSYACTMVKDVDEAEEIVQQVFFKLWDKKQDLSALGSVSAYLYRSVYNESINYIRHQKVKQAHQAHALRSMGHSETKTSPSVTELERKLEIALAELPEKCRTVFQLSRFEELKYHEIAARLGISVKTVENHMGKALKLLRIKLAEFLPILWLLLFNL